MADENVTIKVGFQPDTAGNQKAIAEIEKVKREVLDVQKAVKDTNGSKLSITDAAGGIGGGAGKLRGVASMFGGGELAGLANDAGDAVEGISQLGSTLTELGPYGAAAGVAIAALGLVIADFAKGAQEQADAISREFEAARSVADEIAGGATSDDIRESIEALQLRREIEKQILAESQQSYADFIQGIRDAFGPLAGLVEGILKVIDPREEALYQEQEKSNKLIQESEARERAYNEALEKGLTSKADAKKAEEDRQKAADKAQKDKEAADRKAAQEAEKQARMVEQAAKEAAQIAEQQMDMSIKNSQAIQKINQGALDSIVDINRKAQDAAIDGRNKFTTDLNNLSIKANDEELNAQIKANRAEQAAIKEHRKRIQDIIDRAADAEENAREQRNFIAFVQAQKDAQKELNKQPAEFETGRQERELAAQQERDDRLRSLELARRDLKQGYDQEEVMRRTGIERALRDNQIAKQRQLRDQATGFQQEAELFNRHLQNRLNLQAQFNQAEFQMLQANLNAVTGGGNRPTPAAPSSVFNNSSQIANTQISMTTIGMGGTLQMMRAAGYGR